MFLGPSPYPTHLSVSPWPSPSHSLKESKFNKQKKERQNNAHRNVAIEWMTLQQIPAGQLYSRQSLLFIYFFNLFWNWATCMWARSLQLCPTFGNPVDYNPWRSSVYGILQARKLEWVAISSSSGSSQPRDGTRVSCVSCIAGRFFTAEPPGKPFWQYVYTCANFSALKIHKLTPCPQNVPPVPFQLILPHSWSSSPRQPLTCF